jgi:hypothetical protein
MVVSSRALVCMKVTAEYDIKISREEVPISIYKQPQMSNNLGIDTVRRKPVSNYLEIDMPLPGAPQQGNKRERLTFGSFGFRPMGNYWYGKIVHEEKTVVLRRVEDFHLFTPLLSRPVEHVERSTEGYQFRKAESREEREHRRRNINFLLKRAEQEEFEVLRFSRGEMSRECAEAAQRIKGTEEDGLSRKIENGIFNAKVVNFSELLGVYKDSELVRKALEKCTFHRFGRYFLSNRHYEASLHEIRDKILALFEKSDSFMMKDVVGFIGQESFLLDELCVRIGKRYHLRGHEEETDDMHGAIEDRVTELVRRYKVCPLQKIRDELGVDEVPSADEVVLLPNGYVSIADECEVRKRILSMLMGKKSLRKAEVSKVVQSGEIEDVGEFFDILSEYCQLKGSTWVLRDA